MEILFLPVSFPVFTRFSWGIRCLRVSAWAFPQKSGNSNAPPFPLKKSPASTSSLRKNTSHLTVPTHGATPSPASTASLPSPQTLRFTLSPTLPLCSRSLASLLTRIPTGHCWMRGGRMPTRSSRQARYWGTSRRRCTFPSKKWWTLDVALCRKKALLWTLWWQGPGKCLPHTRSSQRHPYLPLFSHPLRDGRISRQNGTEVWSNQLKGKTMKSTISLHLKEWTRKYWCSKIAIRQTVWTFVVYSRFCVKNTVFTFST